MSFSKQVLTTKHSVCFKIALEVAQQTGYAERRPHTKEPR